MVDLWGSIQDLVAMATPVAIMTTPAERLSLLIALLLENNCRALLPRNAYVIKTLLKTRVTTQTIMTMSIRFNVERSMNAGRKPQ